MKRVCSVILLMCLGMFLPLGSFAQIAVLPACDDCKPDLTKPDLTEKIPYFIDDLVARERSFVVADQIATQTYSYYRRVNFQKAQEEERRARELAKLYNQFTEKVIVAYLEDIQKALNAALKATEKKDKEDKFNTWRRLVDELNKGILSDFDGFASANAYMKDLHGPSHIVCDFAPPDIWNFVPGQDVLAKVAVLENNILEGMISNLDYARAVNLLFGRGYLEFEIIAATPDVVSYYGQTPKITKYVINELSSVPLHHSEDTKKFVEREKERVEERLWGLAQLKSAQGVENLVNRYWKLLGKEGRYHPASSPEDAFLIKVIQMAIRKYPTDTPYLLRKWAYSNHFLISLSGSIELGRWPEREKYFSHLDLSRNKQYLEKRFCKVEWEVKGTAEDKFLARREISWGWSGGGDVFRLQAPGDTSCVVVTPSGPYTNETADDMLLSLFEPESIIGWFLPVPKLTKALKFIYKTYKSMKLSVKSGQSLRRIYKMAKAIDRGKQTRNKVTAAYVNGGSRAAAGSGRGSGKSVGGGNSSKFSGGNGGNKGKPATNKPASTTKPTTPAEPASAPATSYNPRYEQVPEGPVAEGGFSPANPQSRGVPYRENPPRKPWERPDVVYAHPQGAAFVGDEVVFSKQIMNPTSVSGQHHAYILKYSGNPQRPVDVYVRTVGQEGKEVYRLLDVPESAISLSPADIKRLQGQRNGVRIFSDLVPGEISGNFNKVVGFHVATERSIGQSVISNAVNSGGHIKVGQVGRGAKAGQPEIYFELTDNEMKILGKELKNLRNKNRIELKQIKQLQQEFDNLVHQLRTKTNANVRMGRHEVGQFPHAHFENTEQGISVYLNINLQGLAGQQEESVLKAYLFRTFIGKDQKLMQELLR